MRPRARSIFLILLSGPVGGLAGQTAQLYPSERGQPAGHPPDHRSNASLICGDEQAVDQVGFNARFGSARNDNELVDIGHQHVLPATARAAHNTTAWFHAFDDPFCCTLGAKPNDVARGNHG